MSRLRKNTTAVTESKPMECDSDPTDYKIQHPLAAFKHIPAQTDEDHLHQYTEVRPFEDAEWGFKGAKDTVKGKWSKMKMKSAAKKVRKVVDAVENKEQIIEKVRAGFQDKEAFDAAVTKKMTKKEKEIYEELTNDA